MRKVKEKELPKDKNDKLVEIELAMVYIKDLFERKYAGFHRNHMGGGRMVRKHLIR